MKQSSKTMAFIVAGILFAATTNVVMAQETKSPVSPAKAADGKKKAKRDHHDPHTKRQDFGTTTIAGVKFQSITQEGAIVPGEEGAFDIMLAAGEKPPKALRAWIGVASAEGSVKHKLKKEPNRHYHSHVEAPDPIPAGSQYWLEVEPESGAKGKAAFTFFTKE